MVCEHGTLHGSLSRDRTSGSTATCETTGSSHRRASDLVAAATRDGGLPRCASATVTPVVTAPGKVTHINRFFVLNCTTRTMSPSSSGQSSLKWSFPSDAATRYPLQACPGSGFHRTLRIASISVAGRVISHQHRRCEFSRSMIETNTYFAASGVHIWRSLGRTSPLFVISNVMRHTTTEVVSCIDDNQFFMVLSRGHYDDTKKTQTFFISIKGVVMSICKKNTTDERLITSPESRYTRHRCIRSRRSPRSRAR